MVVDAERLARRTANQAVQLSPLEAPSSFQKIFRVDVFDRAGEEDGIPVSGLKSFSGELIEVVSGEDAETSFAEPFRESPGPAEKIYRGRFVVHSLSL